MKTNISKVLASVSARALRGGGLVALLLLAGFVSLAPERAQAQSSDTWKSVAIIGGSTAAGAIIGHQVGGRTGAYVGAAVGAGTGYAIDRRRRQNEYNNGYYGNNGYYNNGIYSGNDPYYGNGGYYGGQGNQYPYGNGYQSTGYNRNDSRCSRR
jgi:hypothetical protein